MDASVFRRRPWRGETSGRGWKSTPGGASREGLLLSACQPAQSREANMLFRGPLSRHLEIETKLNDKNKALARSPRSRTCRSSPRFFPATDPLGKGLLVWSANAIDGGRGPNFFFQQVLSIFPIGERLKPLTLTAYTRNRFDAASLHLRVDWSNQNFAWVIRFSSPTPGIWDGPVM